jgi:hypothetical protein
MKGSRVTPNTAGIESAAKTKSAVSRTRTTRNSGVASQRPARILYCGSGLEGDFVAQLRAIPGVTCVEPGGAFYAYPNVSAHLGKGAADTTALAKQLLEKQHLVCVPGDAFGTPGYIRLSYATSIDRIEEGLRRLEKFFATAEAAR